MLDRKRIRNEPELIKEGIRKKGVQFDIDDFLELDANMRSLIQEVEELKHRKNVVSEKVAELKKKGEDASQIIEEMKETAGRIKDLDATIKEMSEELDRRSLAIPNIPHDSVPVGKCEEDNVEVDRWGEVNVMPFKPLTHWEIGEKLRILDLGRASKLGGRGFVVLKNDGAILSRALINFMLDIHKRQGYQELSIPFMVTRECMIGTGQLPKLEEDMYLCDRDDLFLIPTAEVPVTNLHREEILEGDLLPIKYTAYSACFRREAGSYGKDTRGMVRVHQFDKVEMVKFTTPESSYSELDELLREAEVVLKELGIPYRVMSLCTSDLSFAAAKCYDIETYAPAMDRWLEVSSCSNFEDFQARRANIKFRRSRGEKSEFVHTLNGSGLALPRLIATILEMNQTPTGKVRIPEALVPYMNGIEYLEA
jgi:seryl-tRNA synthetase